MNGSGGTAFVVGDHQIATAAHCIYDKNGWHTPILKTTDSNGCMTDTYLHPVEAHVPKSYNPADFSASHSMYDYALITVSEDLSDYVHFSLGTPYNVSKSAYSNIPIYLTGCPSKVENHEGSLNILFSEEGNVVNNKFDNDDVLYYDLDTSGGNSGGPVYTITKNGSKYIYTAIAIHSGGDGYRNYGAMITNYQLQFYMNNPNASYSEN